GLVDSGTLLLVAIVPLAASIVLTRWADARGPLGTARLERAAAPAVVAAPAGSGALAMVARDRHLIAVAPGAMLTNWVITNGDTLLFRVLQESLRGEVATQGIAEGGAIQAFVRHGTTVFYGRYFFWINLCALLAQAFLASRLLRYGGIAAVHL